MFSVTLPSTKIENVDRETFRKLRKQVPLKALPEEVDKKYNAFLEQFKALTDVLQPADATDFFSNFCTNEKFIELLKKRLEINKEPHDLKWQEIKTSADLMIRLWTKLFQQEELRAQQDVDHYHKHLKKLWSIKLNFLEMISQLACHRFEKFKDEILATSESRAIFINEFGSVVSFNENELNLQQGFRYHSGRTGSSPEMQDNNRKLLALNDEKWLRDLTLQELIKLVNQIIEECSFYSHFSEEMEVILIKWLQSGNNRDYFSYDADPGRRVHTTTVLQAVAILSYPQEISNAEKQLIECRKINPNGGPMIAHASKLKKDLHDLENTTPHVINGYRKRLPQEIKALADDIQQRFELALDLVKPLPELKELKEAVEQFDRLLQEINKAHEALPAQVELGDVQQVESLISEVKKKWEQLALLHQTIPKMDWTVNFEETAQSINTTRHHLSTLIDFYGPSIGGSATQEKLNAKEKECVSKKQEHDVLHEQHKSNVATYQASQADLPNYQELLEKAIEIKKEKAYIEDYKKMTAQIEKVKQTLDYIESYLPTIKRCPDSWRVELEALDEKAALGLDQDPLFSEISIQIKHFVEEQTDKQLYIDAYRESAQNDIEQLKKMYDQAVRDYQEKDLSFFLTTYREMNQKYDKLGDIRFDIFFVKIEPELEKAIELRQSAAEQNKIKLAEIKKNKQRIVARFREAVPQNLSFWNQKFSGISCFSGVKINDKDRVAHSIAEINTILTNQDSNDDEILWALKQKGIERKALPHKNWFFEKKYRYFNRCEEVEHLIEAACTINLEAPDYQKVDQFLPPKAKR